jgi:hypothetical protein
MTDDQLDLEAARLIKQQVELLERSKALLSEGIEIERQYSDFVLAVQHLRGMQRAYFKSRTADDLIVAKNAETRVDQLLEAITSNGDKQPRLPF